MKPITNIIKFYIEGFKNMTIGRTLWIIILIKLFILFVILRIFFFPDFLKTKFDSDTDRSDYVLEELSNP